MRMRFFYHLLLMIFFKKHDLYVLISMSTDLWYMKGRIPFGIRLIDFLGLHSSALVRIA